MPTSSLLAMPGTVDDDNASSKSSTSSNAESLDDDYAASSKYRTNGKGYASIDPNVDDGYNDDVNAGYSKTSKGRIGMSKGSHGSKGGKGSSKGRESKQGSKR
jgi:hypothetical protein